MFGNETSYENYMFFRYGEVLLNFAEAENEVNGPTKEVLDAVNSVRTRNGNMPKVEDTFKSLNKESMREIIRRERRVELCFEDKRWWDIRRWEIADKLPDGSPGVMSVPLNGNFYPKCILCRFRRVLLTVTRSLLHKTEGKIIG